MNATIIEAAIRELTEGIARRQEAIKSLQALNGAPAPTVPRGTSVSVRKDARASKSAPQREFRLVRTTAPAAARIPAVLEKSKTAAGAMKQLIAQSGGTISRTKLREGLLADDDWKELFV